MGPYLCWKRAAERSTISRERQTLQDRPSRALPYGTSEFYASLVDRCVQDLLEALGERNLDAILMIGAPARGEATVVETPGGHWSLSDIDLVCLSDPGAELAGMRDRLASWVTRANQELAGSCTGLDASVKARGSRAQVYPLITNFEMLRSPVVLWGDESVLGELPTIRIEDVPAWDSLVLFHNRVVEQVLLSRKLATHEGRERPGDESLEFREALTLLYTSGKFLMDAVTAFLFLERNVPETYVDRAHAFIEDALSRPENGRLRSAISEYSPDIEAWARFKASGDLSDLASLSEADESDNARRIDATEVRWESSDLTGLARASFARYASCADIMWRAILGRVVGVDAMELEPGRVVSLYSRLETLPRKAVRALKALRFPTGRAGLFAAPRVLRRATFASPRELAYLTAVLAYLSFSGETCASLFDTHADRFCPFEVPSGFARLPLARKRELIIDRLSLFHASFLRGRETRRPQ